MHDIVNILSATFKMVHFMLCELYLNQKPSLEEMKKDKNPDFLALSLEILLYYIWSRSQGSES